MVDAFLGIGKGHAGLQQFCITMKSESIVKLQNYYRSAIKNNVPNIEQMKSAIFATLYHCMSTDEKPQHFKCPGGESSWYFYNRAAAKGNEPPKHEGIGEPILHLL